MEIVKNIDGEKSILIFKGRLDTTTSPNLENVLSEVLPLTNDITFDFKELEYVSSSGLRLILKTHKEMNEKNGKFVLINVSSDIKEVLDLTGFSDFLIIQ